MSGMSDICVRGGLQTSHLVSNLRPRRHFRNVHVRVEGLQRQQSFLRLDGVEVGLEQRCARQLGIGFSSILTTRMTLYLVV
jgi:hypothetical protein